MEITKDLLTKILTGDSTCKITIVDWKIETNIFAQGNNHTSELSRLIVEYQRKSKTFKKSFILKVPSNHPMYNIGIKFKMYEKEYPIYTEVLEEMYKIDGEHVGAKLYYADNKYSIMMKDLTLSGYTVVDKFKQLDFHQCYLVFKNIAKFHALSKKLDSQSKISPTIKRIPWMGVAELEDFFKECSKEMCKYLVKVVDPKFGLQDKILQMKDTLFDEIYNDITSSEHKFKVLNHGDLWVGNTLFKFNKYGQTTKVKLIDFQTPAWMSPVYDIMSFTITSMRFDVFERHFDFLMETYIESLNQTLKFFQCGSYSLQELYRDMDALKGVLIMFLCCQLPHVLYIPENPMDYEKFFKNGKFDFTVYEKVCSSEVYKRIVNQWMSYFVKKGLFDRK